MRVQSSLGTAACALTLLTSCGDQITDTPDGEVQALAGVTVMAPPASMVGCSRLRVELAGRTGVNASAVSTGCAALNVLVTGAQFDRSKQEVRVQLAVGNETGRAARGPVSLYSWADSVAVLSPAGLAQNKHTQTYVKLLNPDSLVAASAPTWTSAQLWRVPTDGITLANGATSLPRELAISVQAGVHSFEVILYTEAFPAAPPVPAVAPDTIPAWVFSPQFRAQRILTCAGGDYVRNVVTVAFHPGTALADKEAAVGSVGGEVIGGSEFAGTDGFYYLRIDEGVDGEGLCQAVDALKVLPQVIMAPPIAFIWRSAYLRPNDGAGFARDDWRVYPDSADRTNWALEAIAAPLAWGCSTGDANTEIAIVDYGFHSGADFMNLSGPDVDRLPRINDHGHAVMSVVGATGNNNIGMTGVLWQSRLRLYDVAVERRGAFLVNDVAQLYTQNILNDLRAAARSGAAAVNLSIGMDWEELEQRGLIRNSTAAEQFTDSLYAENVRDVFDGIPRAAMPLIIIAAGNDGVDAHHGVYPRLVQDYPDHVLVVAGTEQIIDQSMQLWPRSNRGPLVAVAAPANQVAAYDPVGNVVRLNGTSVAAPLVSGIAGLLKSFDPRLTTAEIRALIRDGAVRGGRMVGAGIPVVNAYESLKLAANRPGAPLCGNHLWFVGTRAYAGRGSGQESLFDIGEPGDYLNAMHGGRRVRTRGYDSGRTREFSLTDNSWTSVTPYSAPVVQGGTFYSMLSATHDVDRAAFTRMQVHEYGVQFDIYSRHLATRVDSKIATLGLAISRSSARFCPIKQATYDVQIVNGVITPIFRGYECWESREQDYRTLHQSLSARVAYYPAGDRILLAVTREQTVMTSQSEYYQCPRTGVNEDGRPSLLCQDYTFTTTTLGTTFYSVVVNSRVVTALGSVSGLQPSWAAVSEDGNEIATAGGSYTTNSVLKWVYAQVLVQQNQSSQTQNNCGIRFFKAEDVSPLRSIATADACQSGGAATIAPRPSL